MEDKGGKEWEGKGRGKEKVEKKGKKVGNLYQGRLSWWKTEPLPRSQGDL